MRVMYSDLIIFIVVMSNHQAINIRCVPAVKQPSVTEPGDLARLEKRGPAGAGEGRRGGTGDGGRVRSERRGGRDRPEVARSDDPEPGEVQHLHGDSKGERSRGEETWGEQSRVPKTSKPPGIGFWRMEMTPEWCLSGRTEGVDRKVDGPNDPDSKMMRGSASSGEGKERISVSEAAEKLLSSFGSLPPPTLSKMSTGHTDCEGFFSPSGHFVKKQSSPSYSSQQNRKGVPVPCSWEPSVDRVVRASDLVDKLNRFSRQKSGGLFDIGDIDSSGNCPLCELKCHCLGPSCLQKKGISDK